jgi:cytoskeletal protein CcmA (bactofilin family)
MRGIDDAGAPRASPAARQGRRAAPPFLNDLFSLPLRGASLDSPQPTEAAAMAIWKDPAPRPAPAPTPEPTRFDAPAPSPAAVPAPAPMSRADSMRKESLIAADITIEGKIEGSGNVRIAGKFKGDVNVQGDLTIEAGAKLTGGVRADKVTIAGELEGNIEQASRCDLQSGGSVVGDIKAGSLTVAAGARMKGQAHFGWEDDKSSGKSSRNGGAEGGAA